MLSVCTIGVLDMLSICTIGGGQVQRTCIQEVGQSNYGTCIRIFVEAKPVVHE